MKRLSIASGTVVLTVFVVTFVVAAIDSIGSDYPIGISLMIASVAVIVALIVMVVWAIPVHLLLQKYSRSNVAWYIFSAVIPSFAFVYIFKPFGHDTNLDMLRQALFCSFAGGLGAIAFWFITVYRQRITRL